MLAKTNGGGRYITSNGDVVKFSRNEMMCSCGCDKALMKQDLINKLHLLRLVLGKPIKITSGYRCPEYNTKIKGSQNSQHMKGTAVDIHVVGMTSRDLVDYIERSGIHFSGLGFYPKRLFAHIDVRSKPKFARWTHFKNGRKVGWICTP